MRVSMIPVVVGPLGTLPKCLKKTNKQTGRLKNPRKNRDHKNYIIVEKNPEDLRRLAVTQSSVRTPANGGEKKLTKVKIRPQNKTERI